jgi:hypothetical protein
MLSPKTKQVAERTIWISVLPSPYVSLIRRLGGGIYT